MALVTVLLVVALAAGVLAVMISGQEAALERSTRLREAAQAMSDAEGGILSAIVALRRDGLAAPETDNPGEAWAKIGDRGSRIEGGRFQLAIADAQGLFNINTLGSGGLINRPLFARIASQAGLLPATIAAIEATLDRDGFVGQVADLRRAGLDDAQIAALGSMVTALPSRSTAINLNAVDGPTMVQVVGDAAAARTLIDERNRFGSLSAQSLSSARVALPAGTGFASGFFWARCRVVIGDTGQQLTVLLARRRTRDGIEVVPVARWVGSSAPADAPALPELGV